MLASCLPTTGPDSLTLVMLAAAAAMLLVVGVIAVRRANGRVALALIPLIVVGLAVSSQAQPAQAAPVQIPDTVMSTTWTADVVEVVSAAPSAENLARFQHAAALAAEAGNAPVYRTLLTSPEDSFESWEVVPNIAGPDGSPGAAQMSVIALNAAIFAHDPFPPFGNYPLTVTVTYDYEDDCGRPLQTVFTYSGNYFFSIIE